MLSLIRGQKALDQKNLPVPNSNVSQCQAEIESPAVVCIPCLQLIYNPSQLLTTWTPFLKDVKW